MRRSASGLTVWRFFLVNESVTETILKNDAADFTVRIDRNRVQNRIEKVLQNLRVGADCQFPVVDVGVP